MGEEPGRARRVADFIGVTASVESQRRRPTGSRARWIYVLAIALLVLLVTVAARILL